MSLSPRSVFVTSSHRRHGIAHLIDLYERNYALIEQLVPELDLPFEQAVSQSKTDLPLTLIPIERAPYTVEFRLTYQFDADSGVTDEPNFWVRVYRDARCAEALRCTGRPPWLANAVGNPAVERYLSEQWQRNLMLGRWLEYLLHHGHGFTHVARPRKKRSSKASASL